MATGTRAGLTRQKQPQSVFKHKTLDRYVLPMAAKTASFLPSKRCVVVDGFAGRGRYEDGSAASAEQMMVHAHKLKNSTRMDVFVVEEDEDDFFHLDEVAEVWRNRGVNVLSRRGRCQDYLDQVVALARGASLFLFLDPCGANIPFADLQGVLNGPRRARRPATETLLNINADIIRRSAGAVLKDPETKTTALDTMCGGTWWRQVALDAHASSGSANFAPAADSVVHEYARRLGAAAAMNEVVVSVHRKLGRQAVYYLVFLTRNPHGLWLFGNAQAKARHDWLRFLEAQEEESSGSIPLVTVDDQIKQERHDYEIEIRSNIASMLERGVRSFVPVEHIDDVLGTTYGKVEERVAHKVLRDLVKEKRLIVTSQKKQQYASTYTVAS